jgi:hypothetical protein
MISNVWLSCGREKWNIPENPLRSIKLTVSSDIL